MDTNMIPLKTIEKYFTENTNVIIKHHLDSYNSFFSSGIKNIFKDRNPLRIFKDLDQETKKYKYECDIYLGGRKADKIYYGKPIIYDETREHYMYPNEARLRNMTYGFTIHYDAELDIRILIDKEDGTTGVNKFTLNTETLEFEKVYLGKFPIMLQSNMCILQGLAPEARFNMGECKNDPGGYFVIDGNEKVIVSQEGRGDNLLYILKDINDIYSYAAEIKSVSEDSSKPKRTLSVRLVKEQPSSSNNQIVVNIPQVRKPVPLFIVMRALGIISDKEIIQMCLLDMEKYENLIDLFIPSVHDAGNIFTQQAAISYISSLTKIKTKYQVMQILMNFFLPHIGELNFKAKALYLGYIVKRLLNVSVGQEKPTDRDSFEFKRLSVSGKLIHDLFDEYYKLQLDNIYLKIDKKYLYSKRENNRAYEGLNFINLFIENNEDFFKDRIVEGGFRRGFKGDWGATAHTKKPGISQELNRLSFFGFMCQLRKTNLYISADGAKVIAPRLLHGTQYGLMCPLHSPDGGNVGLHNHLSTSTIITKGCSGKPYIKYLRKLGVKLLEECSLNYMKYTTKIFVNGAWIGCCHFPLRILNIMKMHRRNNMINIYTSIAFNIKRNELIICTDSGRPMRPLFYMVNDKISYERQNIINKYKNNTITWNNIINGLNNKKDMLEDDCKINITEKTIESLIANSNVVDYIDTTEGHTMLLAHSNDKREDYSKKRITHCEIHPSLILGLMANQIIYPENNPYPRDAFSCGQSKQGVSLYHSNYHTRFDKSSFVLNYGQIPLTKSKYLKYTTNEEHPYGENAIVAIMCYSGYNVEDAVIINEASLKRGLFRTTYYNTYQAFEESEKMGNINIEKKFMNVLDDNVLGLKPGYDYQDLDSVSGIIKENSKVTEKSVIMGMGSNSINSTDTYVDNSVYAKKGQVGLVDKAFMTDGEEGKRIAKVRIRGERIPQLGDKFCSRAGQKGTIGMILPECDMPCTEDGIRPDIIVNPHAMPSRMTIGHLVETLTSKTACIYGGFGDCTAFTNKGPKHKEYGEMLTKQGLHSSGNQILYNGMTGEQLETEIYFGPTYYLRLKHMPKDKINYRARGPRTALTRQTVQGRANNGGLRIGEMDRDCLIAHGLSRFINESMMVRGDEFEVTICNKTGCIAIYNESSNIFLSPMADGPIKFVGNLVEELNVVNISKFGRDFSLIKVPYAFKLLMQELQTMNIQMRIITADNVDQLMSLTKGDDIVKLTSEKFLNLEQIKNETQRLQNLNNENMIVKEKTPEQDVFPDYKWMNDMHEITENKMDIREEDGTVLDPLALKDFNPEQGDLVQIKNGYYDNEYQGVMFKIIEYDRDDLQFTLIAQDGDSKGEIVSVYEDEIEKYVVSESFTPDYPLYSKSEDKEMEVSNLKSIGENKEDGEEDGEEEDGEEEDGEEEDGEEEEEEYEKDEDDIKDVLGDTSEEKNEDMEKILESVSSLNKEKTEEGLEKLSTIDEEDENVKEEGNDNSVIKKIT
jgi:DNA-directed RNA polymerase II subunit RPB2